LASHWEAVQQPWRGQASGTAAVTYALRARPPVEAVFAQLVDGGADATTWIWLLWDPGDERDAVRSTMLVVQRGRGEVRLWDPSGGPAAALLALPPWTYLWEHMGLTFVDAAAAADAPPTPRLAALCRARPSAEEDPGAEEERLDGSAPLCLLAFCLSSCMGGRPVPYAALERWLERDIAEPDRVRPALMRWTEICARLYRNGDAAALFRAIGPFAPASPPDDDGPSVCAAWDDAAGAYCRHPPFGSWIWCRYHASRLVRETYVRSCYADLPPTRSAAATIAASRAVFVALSAMGLDPDLRVLEHPERFDAKRPVAANDGPCRGAGPIGTTLPAGPYGTARFSESRISPTSYGRGPGTCGHRFSVPRGTGTGSCKERRRRPTRRRSPNGSRTTTRPIGVWAPIRWRAACSG
jgi:hypothetical protein